MRHGVNYIAMATLNCFHPLTFASFFFGIFTNRLFKVVWFFFFLLIIE